MKQWISKHSYVCWTLYLPVYLVLFFIVERIIDGSSAYWSSYMPLDDRIPFVAAFVVPYCLWYPLLIFTGLYLCIADVPVFRRYMQFIAITFTLATVFCFLVPNGQDLRPSQFGENTVFTRTVQALYRTDTNTNVFPSVHVLGGIAAVFAAFASQKLHALRFPILVLVIAITLSTVMIKQHSALDVLGSFALGVPVWIILRRRQSYSS